MSSVQAAEAIAAQFEFTDEDVQKCFEGFLVDLRLGLNERRDTVCQTPTYTTRLAHGTEKGFCLGIDVGGTNLRVCSVELHGDSTYTADSSSLAIPKNVMLAKSAHDLFSFIATHVRDHLADKHPDRLASKTILSLGFCFAFPVHQDALDSGILLRWTKGFDVDGVVNNNIGELLQKELDALEVPAKVTAIVNDALGTIMTRAFTLPVSQTRTSVGAIFGTGTNAVYLEQLSTIRKDIGEHDATTGEMFLSTEWGSLDNELKVLPNTEFDQELDDTSFNKGNQIFEKRIGGMFLGELLRLSVKKLYDDPEVNLFHAFKKDDSSIKLHNRWTVDSSILSIAEEEETPDLDDLRKKCEDVFGVSSLAMTLQDLQAIQKIARAIGRRAARLAGTAIGAIIHQSGKLEHIDPMTLPSNGTTHGDADGQNSSGVDKEAPVVDVGVDGSVVEHYPRFEHYMRDALRAIDKIGADGERRIRIGLVKDGSSIGTAITALLGAQQKRDIEEQRYRTTTKDLN